MSTHFHLAIETAEPNLSEGMKWLQGTRIRRYNAFRDLIKRPFQGAACRTRTRARASVPLYPPQSSPCTLVSPGRSHTVFMEQPAKIWGKDRPAWLNPSTVLLESGDLPDTLSDWNRYNAYLEFLATDDFARKELVAERMRHGWCLGDMRFKLEMKAAAAETRAELERFAGLEPGMVRQGRAEG